MKRVFYLLKHMDWWLVGAVFLLVIIGLATLYSIGANGNLVFIEKFYKQLIIAGVGVLAFIVMTLIDARIYSTIARTLGVISILLLIAVLFFGETLHGTTGWFLIGPFSFQPVELVKIFFVLFCASFFASRKERAGSWLSLTISGAVMLACVALVAIQPDLGSALILVAVWLGMIFIADTKPIQLVLILGGLLIIGIIGWTFFMEPYQHARILTFINPDLDPLGSGYNVTQSVIAVGSGGLFGRGLGLGPQSQLNFLPAQETDFVFAVIAESLGFFGGAVVLSLFGIVFWRLWVIMSHLRDEFGVLVIAGFFWIFLTQLLINVGMNMGIMPVTGIPLPFISSGGSALIVLLAATGIIQSFIVRQKSGILAKG